MEWSHQELIPLDFEFQLFGIQSLVQIQIRLLLPEEKVIIYKQIYIYVFCYEFIASRTIFLNPMLDHFCTITSNFM